MQSCEIYQAQNARFTGEFTAAFALTPPGAVLVRDVMLSS